MSSETGEIYPNQRNDHGDCEGSTTVPVVAKNEPVPVTLGQRLNKLELPAFTFTEAAYQPCTELPPHIHGASSFCLTLSGYGVELNGALVENTRPGTLIIRPPGQVHSDRFGPVGARTFITEVNPEWLNTFHEFSRIFADARYLHGGLIPSLALRIYQESRIKDGAASIIVEGLMLELLGSASRWLVEPPVRIPPWLKMARDLCHCQFNDPLTLMGIAEVAGVHPTHLARAFKKHYRCTVGDYLRRLRLDWASKQLANSEDSVAEIAVAAGFYDQSHFIHTLKRLTGLTPAEIRASRVREAGIRAADERASRG
jgi:AraC family transcriptional regulator